MQRLLSAPSFGKEIKHAVELSTAIVVGPLVVSPVPVDLCAALTDVECLKHLQRSVSHRCLNCRSEICLLLAAVILPLPQPLTIRKLNRQIFLGLV